MPAPDQRSRKDGKVRTDFLTKNGADFRQKAVLNTYSCTVTGAGNPGLAVTTIHTTLVGIGSTAPFSVQSVLPFFRIRVCFDGAGSGQPLQVYYTYSHNL